MRLRTFQELSTRARGEVQEHQVSVSVCVFVFDIMMRDGQSLLGLPLRERRAQLVAALPGMRTGYVQMAVSEVVDPSPPTLVPTQEEREGQGGGQKVEGHRELLKQQEQQQQQQQQQERMQQQQQRQQQEGGRAVTSRAQDADAGAGVSESECEGAGAGVGGGGGAESSSRAKDASAGAGAGARTGASGGVDGGGGGGAESPPRAQDAGAGVSESEGARAGGGGGAESSSRAEDAVHALLLRSLDDGAEGLMLKSLDAAYEPSRRSEAWIKVKRDYVDGLRDSLDLVPIGAWHGQGRKSKWLSPFLMAVWDPDGEQFQSVCRCMSGFSDAFYEAATARLARIPGPKPYYSTGEACSVWFEPTEVWEVRGADLTLSPVHTAAAGRLHPERGVGLRFPRFIRIRDDKEPEDASTPEYVAALYNKQTRKAPTTAAPAAAPRGGKEGAHVGKQQQQWLVRGVAAGGLAASQAGAGEEPHGDDEDEGGSTEEEGALSSGAGEGEGALGGCVARWR
ncbi:hypothetical protein FOA52_010069 [Chlamydomonas sp. UWO 241]|nr:hypothetical protein FOA52_010069 [Chlamydomonas sp. UWO 241]